MQEVMGYRCPVCGYDELPRPPDDYLICPSCGTEFGYDDFADTDLERQRRWNELRKLWFDRGMPWFSTIVPEQPIVVRYVRASLTSLNTPISGPVKFTFTMSGPAEFTFTPVTLRDVFPEGGIPVSPALPKRSDLARVA
jgi:rubredoxin